MPWCFAAKEPSAARPAETEGPDDREAVAGVRALGVCDAGAAAFVAWFAACSFVATDAWISGLDRDESHEAAIQFWTWAREAPWGSMPRALAAPRSSSRDLPFAQE